MGISTETALGGKEPDKAAQPFGKEARPAGKAPAVSGRTKEKKDGASARGRIKHAIIFFETAHKENDLTRENIASNSLAGCSQMILDEAAITHPLENETHKGIQDSDDIV